MAYNPKLRPRHPVVVAELNDSAALVRIANELDAGMDDMATVPARTALIHAVTILRGASKNLRN